MSERKYDFDVTRAVGVLNAAMRHNMFPQGAIPESDADKIVAADQVVAGAEQAKKIGDQVGRAKVPQYQAAVDVLFEAFVTAAAGNAPPDDPEGRIALLEAARESLAPAAPAATPPPTEAPPAPSEEPKEPAPDAVPSGRFSSAAAAQAATQPHKILPAEQPTSTSGAVELQPGEVWSDPAGGEWTVQQDLGANVEVASLAGEVTTVPRVFLKRKVRDPEPPVLEVTPYITVVATPAQNSLVYTHPLCPVEGPADRPTRVGPTQWVVPLDDVLLPKIGEEAECAECARVFPITAVEANGYVSPHEHKEEPSQSQSPSQPESSTPAASTTSGPPSTPTAQGDDGSSSATSSRAHSPSQSSPGSSPTSTEVDDDEGDEAYRKLLDRAERDWAPASMPIPVDMETEPLPMPDDLTGDETLNRQLHSQFNALAARARYLGGLERAKARQIARARRLRELPAKREARAALGKDATETAVREMVEQDDVIAAWIRREAHHSEKATAYQTFFEMYTEHVTTLSRDLTWAQSEEKTS